MDFDSGRALASDGLSVHGQPSLGGRGADVVEDRLHAVEWDAGPTLADLTEEATLGWGCS